MCQVLAGATHKRRSSARSVRALLPAIIGTMLCLGLVARAETLNFGLIDLPPYVLPEPSPGEPQGLYPEIVRELCRRAGITPEMHVLPLSRIVAELEFAHIDASINLKNGAMDAFSLPVHDVLQLVNVAIPRRDVTLASFADLRGLTVVQTRGAFYDPRVRPDVAGEAGITLYEMNRSDLLPQFVRSGRAGAMIGTLLGLRYSIRQVGYTEADFGTPLQLNTRASMLYLSRKARQDAQSLEVLRARLDRALTEMTDTGWIAAAYTRYGG